MGLNGMKKYIKIFYMFLLPNKLYYKLIKLLIKLVMTFYKMP